MSRRRHPPRFSGLLPVIKEAGPTSHDVVDMARRALKERRIGHTGTLDPMAEGLLLLCVGHATRLQQYLLGWPKTYHGVVRLGFATTTYDREGEEAEPRGEAPVCDSDVLAGLQERFSGTFDQVPPPYSAKKVDGRSSRSSPNRSRSTSSLCTPSGKLKSISRSKYRRAFTFVLSPTTSAAYSDAEATSTTCVAWPSVRTILKTPCPRRPLKPPRTRRRSSTPTPGSRCRRRFSHSRISPSTPPPPIASPMVRKWWSSDPGRTRSKARSGWWSEHRPAR